MLLCMLWCCACCMYMYTVDVMQVNYSHPAAMKREEENVPGWSEKRLLQLNFLFKHVAAALKEATPPPAAVSAA